MPCSRLQQHRVLVAVLAAAPLAAVAAVMPPLCLEVQFENC
jgi:hypothetical protein